MARIRTIKPDFWTDDVIADLDPLAMLLYIGMWNFADDEGYLKDSVGQLRRQIFPDRGFDVAGALDVLLDRGRVVRMDSDQGRILYLPKLLANQKIAHPTPTKFTGIRPLGSPPEDSRALVKTPEASALKGGEGKGMEGRGREDAGGVTPPVDNSEPPTRCPAHLTTATPPKCGQCKDARVAHQRWEQQQTATAPPRPSARRPGLCRHLQKEGECDMCDYEATHDDEDDSYEAEVIRGRFGAA